MRLELVEIRTWRARSLAIVAVGIAIAPPLTASSLSAPLTGQIATVTDGDTVRLTSGERIRIAGIDAPESQVGQAKCALELTRGRMASERARALLTGRTINFVRTGKSYRRTVARVSIDGRDLGEWLTELEIARPWPRHSPKPDWCR